MTACAIRKRSVDAMEEPHNNNIDDSSSHASSPLSVLSRSPSPPQGFASLQYPSPLPSQRSSQENSPSPDAMSTGAATPTDEGAPPAKKRKLHAPKPRTSSTLNLLADDVDSKQKEQLDQLLKVLHKRRKIVVIAGAGISVSAGIPDFRSSTGLFRSLKSQHKLKSSGKDLFDASVYKDDNSTTQFHDMVRNLATMTQSARPTPFHHMLATLAQEGRLLRLYSQNVDGIDTQLPPLATHVPLNRKGPWPKTVQLHGNVEKMVCSKCRQVSELNPALFDGPTPPLCQHCVDTDDVRTKHAGKRSHGVGRLRPRMVLYNEHNPDDEAIGAVMKADLHKRPDALIVVGTSLKVPGVRRIVKEMCGVVRDRRDGVTIWMNHDLPPLVKDFEWDLIVQGPCDEVARRACMRRWDEPEDVESATEERVNKVEQSTRLSVLIDSPKKNIGFERVQGVITPVASPQVEPLVFIQQKDVQEQRNSADAIKPKAKPGRKPGATKIPKVPKPPKAKGQTTSRKQAGIKASMGNQKINQSFTISKSAAQVQISKSKQTTEFVFATPTSAATGYSLEQPLRPVSPSAARNNASPPFAPPRGKGFITDELEVAKTRNLSIAITPRRCESPEERRRTISPTGPLPSGMKDLLHLP